MNWKSAFLVTGILIIAIGVVFTLLVIHLIMIEGNKCESCILFNPKAEYGLNGIYFKNSTAEYYCVWTKDRLPSEITNYDEHEKCHILILKDYKHFCNISG